MIHKVQKRSKRINGKRVLSRCYYLRYRYGDTLTKDLKTAGIPHQDESGRYVDFHSLRYTWGIFLQRNGVNSRVAMELMRHSDRKLTDKIYTDSSLLPLKEVVSKLPKLPQVSQIVI